MRKCLILIALAMGVPAYADNIADCEAVMIEEIKEGERTGAVVQTFAPAVDVLASIYDDEDGHMAEIDGKPVKAILCERTDVIPTLRDFPILATGIPLALSTDFDATDSRSVTLYFKDGKFHHVFKGEELDETDQAKLTDAMEVFNLQPHELAAKEKAKNEGSDEVNADEESAEAEAESEADVENETTEETSKEESGETDKEPSEDNAAAE